MGVRAARSRTREAEVPTRPAKCALCCPHRPHADGNSSGARVFANSFCPYKSYAYYHIHTMFSILLPIRIPNFFSEGA